jgi:hypothetical protein
VNNVRLVSLSVVLSVAFAFAIAASTAVAATTAEVTVGSPHHPFPRNKQNEPAVAIDASRPHILAAGANDEIDLAPCGTTVFATPEGPCPFTPGVGVTGVQFSFDSGKSWVQPTYTGWSARDGTPGVGPIGTLPWYYETGLVSDGDPAMAFGPIPRDGEFSWANGSRLYFTNLTSNFPAEAIAEGRASSRDGAPRRALELDVNQEPGPVVGFEAIAVSRADNVGPSNFNNKNTWMRPVIASKAAGNTQFADKEQIWADNAASSPFFGNVYVCYASFRAQTGASAPLFVSTSKDGGSTWQQKQVTAAHNVAPRAWGQSGCTIRTTSEGVVYVFYEEFQNPFHGQIGLPPEGDHKYVVSYNGGDTWTRPRHVRAIVDPCFFIDPITFRCVEDGIAGSRNDLAGSPNIDIANGAPSGEGATDMIVDSWVDARQGLNNEKVLLAWADAGVPKPAGMAAPVLDWQGPQVVSTGSDRGYYTAPALSPDGSDLYLTYNAFTTPFRDTTFTPRGLIGVFRMAAMMASGPSGWTTLHRSPVGDPRGSAQNNLQAGFLGDYVYTDAMNDYGVGVWNDARNATVCPAINAWQMALRTDPDSAGNPPNPLVACPTGFGDTDIWSFTTHP